MAKKNPIKKAKESGRELAYVGSKAVLSAVPLVGGSLAEIFAYLVNEPIAKRRDEWIEEIAGRIDELGKQLDEPLMERLQKDESFTTVLLSASQIAIRTHQKEKIDILANAVLNSALGKIPDDTERSIMLGLIDRLTPAHIAILTLMSDPRRNAAVMKRLEHISMGGLTLVIFSAFPKLAGQDALIELLWRDLVDAGLLNSSGINVTMTGPGLLSSRTTSFGERFLQFVANPLHER